LVRFPLTRFFQTRLRCPCSTSLAAAAASASSRRCTSESGVPSGMLTSNSTRNSIALSSRRRRRTDAATRSLQQLAVEQRRLVIAQRTSGPADAVLRVELGRERPARQPSVQAFLH